MTSFCRQTLNIELNDWSSPEVGETIHGFCLECCAEVPKSIMKKFLKGGKITEDYPDILKELVNGAETAAFVGNATVSLEVLNKARVALGYKAL